MTRRLFAPFLSPLERKREPLETAATRGPGRPGPRGMKRVNSGTVRKGVQAHGLDGQHDVMDEPDLNKGTPSKEPAADHS